MSSEYEFLSVFLQWFNREYGRRHGTFNLIDSVEVRASGCGEGTCQWEDIVITGDDDHWRPLEVRLEAVDVSAFFRSVTP